MLKILTYNTQLGARGLSLIKALLLEKVDVWCFQRFPEKWLEHVDGPCIYQPSFMGADNGCLTVHRVGSYLNKGLSKSVSFDNKSQAVAFIELSIQTNGDDIILVNTLPPYPEENVTEQDYVAHLNFLFSQSGRRIIVGDFHFDRIGFDDIRFESFELRSRLKNFIDREGEELALTKIFSNFEVKLNEKLILPAKESNRHNPVKIELDWL